MHRQLPPTHSWPGPHGPLLPHLHWPPTHRSTPGPLHAGLLPQAQKPCGEQVLARAASHVVHATPPTPHVMKVRGAQCPSRQQPSGQSRQKLPASGVPLSGVPESGGSEPGTSATRTSTSYPSRTCASAVPRAARSSPLSPSNRSVTEAPSAAPGSSTRNVSPLSRSRPALSGSSDGAIPSPSSTSPDTRSCVSCSRGSNSAVT
ncbi:hypothetical protein ACLESO_36635 [Pyxidicoccus sp. 3LG]